MDTIRSPKLPSTPDFSFEPLDKGDRSRVTKSKKGIQGEVSFLFMTTPNRSGELNLPPISLEAFDPVTEKHYEVATKPIPLTVMNASDEEMAALEQGGLSLRPLTSRLEAKSETGRNVLSLQAFLIASCAPVLFLILGLFRKKVLSGSPARARATEANEVLQAMKKLKSQLNENDFERDLQALLKRWRTLHPPEALSNREDITRWATLEEQLNLLRFSPDNQSASQRAELLSEALALTAGSKGGSS